LQRLRRHLTAQAETVRLSAHPQARLFARNWHPHFRTWRKRRLREVEREYGDRLDEVADFLAEFANKIKALGPKAYLESTAHRSGEDLLDDDPLSDDEE
jgi:hypothetical protein